MAPPEPTNNIQSNMQQEERGKYPKKDDIEDMHGIDSWGDAQFGFDVDFALEKVGTGVGVATPARLKQILWVDRRAGVCRG
jgi:hypothetical protein